MADVTAQTMHQDFARWYSAASLGNDQRRRQARWDGVYRVVSDADRDTVEGLLRLAHRSRKMPTTVVQAIRLAFKAADDAFEMSGNDRELAILSGACLAVLMQTNQSVGPAAALSATTAGLHGGRRPDLPMDLASLAEPEIARWGGANRERPSLSSCLPSDPLRVDFEKAASKVGQQSWEAVSEAFELAANATHLALERIAAGRSTLVRAVEGFLRVQDEELQMLWWLTARRSSDYNCTFDAIPSDARPLVLAKELADQTQFLPGPPSILGLLSHAGLKQRKRIPIPVAVNAADSGWLQEALGELNPSPVATPLHDAIKRQLDTGPGDDWVAGWAASTGVAAAHALSGLTLGNLFYRERLLLLFE